MAKHKPKQPKLSQRINLALQNRYVQQRFPDFSCHINNGRAVWYGYLQPRTISSVYKVKIEYNPRLLPKVKVLFPKLASKTPHLYCDKSLCLYWPKEWRWQPDTLIADAIIPWTASWLYYYELWLDTDKWLGPSSHDDPK